MQRQRSRPDNQEGRLGRRRSVSGGGPGLVRRASKAAQHYLKERRLSAQHFMASSSSSRTSLDGERPGDCPDGPLSSDDELDASALSTELSKYLQQGTEMLKVTAKKTSKRIVKLNKAGELAWQSYSIKAALLGAITEGGAEAGMHWTTVPLEHILELRFTSDASNYREQFRLSAEHEPKWMTVIFTAASEDGERTIKIVHFVVLGPQRVADTWRQALKKMVKAKRRLLEECLTDDFADSSQRWKSWLQQCWSKADSDQNDRVSFEDVLLLCKDLGIKPNIQDLQSHFDEADGDHAGYLDMEQFQTFVKSLRHRPEIETLLREITSDNNAKTLKAAHFETFLREQQQVQLSSEECHILFNKYATQADAMTAEELANFLRSEDNAASDDRHRRVWQDMSRPLCEYFISCSHNVSLDDF